MQDYPEMQAIKMDATDAYEMNKMLNAYECGDFIAWRAKSLKNRDFCYDIQFTDEEISVMEAKGQYPIAINRIRKAMNSLTGMLTANLPEYKALPVGREDSSMSEIATKLLKYMYHKADALPKIRKAVMQGVRDNIGWLLVERGEDGEIAIENIPMEYILPDPSATDPLYKDAERLIRIKWISSDQVQALYGVRKEDISLSEPPQWSSLRSADGDDIQIHPVVSTHKQHVKVHECFTKVKERNFVETNMGPQWDGTVRTHIEKQTIIGFDIMFREVMSAGITEFPLVPIYAEDTESAYKLGETNFLITLQRLLNKCFGIMLLNAQLASNPKVFVWEDTIPDDDIEAFETNYANPGSVNILVGSGDKSKAPIVVQGLPINNAWYTMVQMIFGLFEFNTISNQSMAFNDSKKFATMLFQQRETILDSYKVLTGHLDSALIQLGRISLQMFKAYDNGGEKLLRITEGAEIIDRVQVNKQQGFDFTNDESIQRYRDIKIQQGTDFSTIERNIAKAKQDLQFAKSLYILVNEVSDIDVDLFIVPNSYTPSYTSAKFQISKELLELGAVDPQAVLELAPLDNVQEILGRVSEVQRLKGELGAALGKIEEQGKMIEQINGALIQKDIDVRQVEHQGKLDKTYTDARGKESKAVAIFRKDLNFKMAEINRLVKKLQKLEIEADKGESISLTDIMK